MLTEEGWNKYRTTHKEAPVDKMPNRKRRIPADVAITEPDRINLRQRLAPQPTQLNLF